MRSGRTLEEKVRVSCRFRPLSAEEQCGGLCVVFDGPRHVVCGAVPQSPSGGGAAEVSSASAPPAPGEQRRWVFARVYGTDTTQREIYDDAARPIVDDVMHGYNGTLLVYGQTGGGKTHTMFGLYSRASEGTGPPVFSMHDDSAGIVPRAARHLFQAIHAAEEAVEFEIRLQFVEIYMEHVRDLLNPSGNNLHVREDPTGFFVENCETPYVTNTEEVLQFVRSGLRRRATAATASSDASSRSHCVLSITVRSVNKSKHEATIGKLFLVDLAGCEKASKTLAGGLRLEEAKLINKSLTTLGHVIICLAEKQSHVPYRDSKLTRLLHDSLGGNSRTALILCCSPSLLNAHETLSTLRFGERAQNVYNRAIVNRQLTMEELKSMLDLAKIEIQKLRNLLREKDHNNENNNNSNNNINNSNNNASSSSQEVMSPRGASEARGEGRLSQRVRDLGDSDSVDALLQQGAREQLSLVDMQVEVDRLRDALRSAQYTSDILHTQSAAQTSLVQLLQQECEAWEEEFIKTIRELYAQRRYAEHCRLLFLESHEEAELVPLQLSSYIEQLHELRGLVEDQFPSNVPNAAAGVVASSHRQTGRLSDGRASSLITNVSASQPVSPRACITPREASGSTASHARSQPIETQSRRSQLLRYNAGPVRHDNFTAAMDNDDNAEGNNGWIGFHSTDDNSSHKGLKEEMRLDHMAAVVDELEKLRNVNGALKLELQLAEKKLSIRHERIENLRFGLRQECAARQELQQMLENERASHRAQLQDVSNDALYWRQQYDDLLNNSHAHDRRYSERQAHERRSSTPALEAALTARGYSSPRDSFGPTVGHGIIVKPIRGGGQRQGQ